MLYAPQRWLVGTALRNVTLPLWNPYAGTGIPLFAETIHGVLHPLSVAAAFLFPKDGLDPLLALYVLSSGLGAAALARSLKISWPSAAAAAFAYGLSGFTLSMTGNLVYLAGAASLPWMVAGLVLAGSDRKPLAFAAGSIGFAVCAFSGDIQALATGGVLGLCLAISAGGWKGFVRAMSSAFIGAILAGIQLVPSWLYFQQSARAAGVSFGEEHQWALSVWRLAEFVIPGFFSRPEGYTTNPLYIALGEPINFAEPFVTSIFVGAPVLLLAIAGLRSCRAAIIFGISALSLTWLSLGHTLGADQVMTLIPVVKGFRYAEKYVGPLTLCLAVLAGFGADRVAADKTSARRAIVSSMLISILLFFVFIGLSHQQSISWLAASGVPESALVRMKLLFGSRYVFLSLTALAGCLLLARRFSLPLLPAIAFLVWLQSVLCSPFALTPGHPVARLDVPAPELNAPEPGPRILEPYRIRSNTLSRPGWDREDRWAFANAAILEPSFNVRHRIDNLDVDTGLSTFRYFQTRVEFGIDWPRAGRRYGVTHLIVATPRDAYQTMLAARATEGGTFLGLEQLTGASIWKVPHREWASFPSEVQTVQDRDTALYRLLAISGAGSRATVIEAPGPLAAAPGRIHSLSRERERIEIVAETDADGVLVVNDAFSPGWRAYLDGNHVPIWPADVLVRSVPWPAGRHKLVMRYEPPEVKIGACVSATGLAVLVLICLLCRRKRPSAA
jgi:hypothetical protein